MAIASSTGAQLQRAEIYSHNHRGKKIKRARHHMDVACTACETPRRSCTGAGTKGVCCGDCWHPDIVPAKETRSWAPRPVESTGRETFEERTARDGRYENFLASLSAEEKIVLEMQGRLSERVEVRAVIAAGDLVDYQRDGYTLIPGSDHMVERGGLPPLECVEVYGWERVDTERMARSGDGEWIDGAGVQRTVKRQTYADIAARIGKSISMVNKIVSKVNSKLRALTF